jgi:hypothetical protein
MNVFADIYDLVLMLFVGFALGCLTTISVQDISDYVRSRRGSGTD